MKIALSIYKNETLKNVASRFDAAILMSKYAYVYNENFDIDETINDCKKLNKEVIISLTKVFVENELDDVKNYILKYKENKFLVSDLGIVFFMIENGLENNVIYHPDTLLCNSLDLANINEYNFAAFGLSNEITIDDLKSIYSKCKSKIFYQVFGRKIMFYSRRKLLELYKNHYKLDFKNENLTLVEEMRSYHIPFLENENGFFCFRPYFISTLKHIKELSFIEYAYFDSLDLTDKQVSDLLNLYNESYDENINEKLTLLGINIEDGFNYNDTAYVKEKMFNE